MPSPIAEISPLNQIELPQAIRDELNWSPGRRLLLMRRKNGIFVCPVVTFNDASCRRLSSASWRPGRSRPFRPTITRP